MTMGASRLLLLLSFFFLLTLSSKISADTSGDVVGHDHHRPEDVGSAGQDSSLQIELDRLKSDLRALETQFEEKTREVKSKDDIIAEKEKNIQAMADSVASLENEIASLQEKGKMDADQRVEKAHARAGELQKQVEKFKKEIETKDREKEALESKNSELDKKMVALNLKLENLEKIIEEQKMRIHKTERALQHAEEELMKAKLDATSKTNELIEVHGAWLPPWLALHLVRSQSFIEKHWNMHGKPALDKGIEKLLEKKVQFQQWAEPHAETIKVKWIPVVKEQWLMVTTSAEPHVRSLATKATEIYEAFKNAVSLHLIQVKESLDPYFQKVKTISKPYIDHVATVTKPHVDQVHVAIKPYTKEIVQAYGKFLESATIYHQQVQGTVQDTLQKHELTRPFATKELVWFAASAVLALPILILPRFCSAIFCKKVKKPSLSGNSHNARRKPKRGHPDK
ncbi:hypothetical protein NMG60_11001285 [Bertholletia excelsa]